MMRGGTTKEPLQTDASFFWMTCAHVFLLGGSSTGGVSLGPSRKVGSNFKAIIRSWRRPDTH